MIDYITLRNFDTHSEIRIAHDEFNKRYIELIKEKGYRVTNDNYHYSSRDKFIRLVNFTTMVNPKNDEVTQKFYEKGWGKSES